MSDEVDEFLALHAGLASGEPSDDDLEDNLEREIAAGRLAGSTFDPRMDSEFAMEDGEDDEFWYLPEEWEEGEDDDLD